MWETLYGMALAFPLVCWIFIPVYYRLNTNSVYEYLQWLANCFGGQTTSSRLLRVEISAKHQGRALHVLG
ncbi:jg10437 [Pararge aegeria aegeria]|uniref:Jg10437 protein n=1 Tax=Pararge aegeria aegeria TaxID=348720 RepID=A0A8S4QXK6_9NEOP|nr:jg10437 [Pararge aegeria aegeria]